MPCRDCETDELITEQEKCIIALELQNEACVDRIVWEQGQYYTLLEHYRDLLDDYNELKERLNKVVKVIEAHDSAYDNLW